ncbi:MAG: P-loop NTPase [Verrucomicrobia bacterium]|nr:P-loop NTPase [Verrucomicrobiota bacterium]
MNATRQLPANFGPLKGAQAHARITGPCGDTMEFWLKLSGDRVTRATFTTDGCGASFACGSMVASMAEGSDLIAAGQITPGQALAALEGLPPDHQHCAVLAVNTLRAALANCGAPGKPGGRTDADRESGTAAEAPKARPAPPPAPGPRGPTPEEEEAFRRRLARMGLKILVLSGKGGVGKSTVAVNLAVALAASGKRVGLLDVDVHGPSVPKLLGLEGRTMEMAGEKLQPVPGPHGLKVASLGFLLRTSQDAVIWRGPMKYKAIRELLGNVEWGELDVLVVDSPPGTGDEPLAVAQSVGQPAAAIVVTTPQQVAIADVRRSITFCRQVGLPVLGLIENLSGYACPHCGHSTALFKSGGGEYLAQEMEAPFLGRIPVDPAIVDSGDGGQPFAEPAADRPCARAFAEITGRILERFQTMKPMETPKTNPLLKIAIPLVGDCLSDHFGHCEQFALIDANPDTKAILQITRVTPPPHEPGLLPRWLHEQGVQIIIAGGMGQRALSLFAENGITVRSGLPGRSAEELAKAFLEGGLSSGPAACERHERGCHG